MGHSAKKHLDKSHDSTEFNGGIFKDSEGQLLTNEPSAKQLESAEELASYKAWLKLLTEEMIGSLNPNAKGKTLERLKMHLDTLVIQWK